MSNKTIREAWAFGQNQLAQASFAPDLDTRLLLEHVLQVTHSYLIAHDDVRLSPEQDKDFHLLLSRAKNKEPIPYLTGKSSFYGLDLAVNPSVLIPRPETEELVERALTWAAERDHLTIVDVGTGSGCIAITLSREMSPSTILATDISYAALQTAIGNADNHAQQPIHFLQGNLLLPLSGPFDLIIANLPYIADDEWTMVDDGVKWYEPSEALYAGADGLDLLRNLLHQATYKLRPGGAIFLEIGWQQGLEVQRLANEYFPRADIKVIADLAGQDRIIQILTDRLK